MRRQFSPIRIILPIGALLLLFVLTLQHQNEDEEESINFGGGPTGSTVQNFAEELGRLFNSGFPLLRFHIRQTSGSIDNLLGIESGKLDMALVSTEDTYLGLKGELREKPYKTDNARVVVRLFGSYAQLLVPQSSPVTQIEELAKKRVAIGSPGSDSAVMAKRFFMAMGLWDSIIPIFVGYELALQELIEGSVEAVWLVSGFPNKAVQRTDQFFPLRLISPWHNIPTTTGSKQFYKDFPFYEISILPPGIYRGQPERVVTVGISILWVTDKDMDPAFIYDALGLLYNEKNLRHLHEKYPATWQLDLSRTITPAHLPMHPGAVKFLRENL